MASKLLPGGSLPSTFLTTRLGGISVEHTRDAANEN